MILPTIEKRSLPGSGLTFSEEQYVSRGESPLHAHEETEIVFFLEGTVEDVRRRGTVLRTPSTLLVIPAGEPHGGRVPAGLRLFEVWLQPSWLQRFQDFSPLLNKPVDLREGIPIGLARRLYREFQTADSLAPLMLEALTLELLVEWTRAAIPSVTGPAPRWVRDARDYLHSRFAENPSLEEVAVAAGVHPSHLTRGFRQHCHCTPGDYLRQLRVEHAKRLLAGSCYPLAQIASECGFAHQSHFSRVFKEHTGTSPAAYRRSSGMRV